ncbi:MAG: flagellar assembly peptidoglycan hydrolase FlgJ [Burkholderiaceae bacterium]|nr:flagellar assembly peptidoglycan hydrolase FlgJ [Burkholderiaceae bacterium]
MVASTQSLAASGAGLDALRASARQDPKAAIREVARQFEALFMQELMKSMRASTMATGMLDNQATEMATGMLDQQYATQLAGLPGGLAEAIARQLERQTGTAPSASRGAGVSGAVPRWQPLEAGGRPLAPAGAGGAAAAGAYRAVAQAGAAPAAGGNAARFVEQHRAAAASAAAASGIPAEFMLGQAAHETGWGRREIRGADGVNSHNLFGIKAGGNWRGPVVVTTTTEVIDGQPRKVQAAFRAYASYEESFRDYARLISGSPRYAAVMEVTGDAQAFARGLQRAGYATDPDYAVKLGRVIQTARRLVDQADAARASAGGGLPGVTA